MENCYMSIGFWILDNCWRLVSKEEFYKFKGLKTICPKDRTPSWEIVTSSLLKYR